MRFSHVFAALAIAAPAIAAFEQKPLLDEEPNDGGHGGPGGRPGRPGRPGPPKDLYSLHRELVGIDSVTGNEGNIASYLMRYLSSVGMTFTNQVLDSNETDSDAASVVDLPGKKPKRPNRGRDGRGRKGRPSPRSNIYASFASETSSANALPRVILTTHMDTVPPFYGYNASTPSIGPDTEISGRGSVDAKASIAAQITALISLVRSSAINETDVALLFVVGEETGGDGMKHFSDSALAKDITNRYKSLPTVIFGEPTEGKLACGHKGIAGFKIKATGKTAHSGYPWLGISANDLLVKALAGIQDLVQEGGLPSSKKYGNTTVNIGSIQGGVATNVVADEAIAGIGIRVAKGSPKDVITIIQDAVKKATKDLLAKGGKIDFVFDQGEGYGPIAIDCEGPEGFETLTVNYGTDVPNLTFGGKKYRKFLYGPGSIFVAHSDHESLKASELQQAVEDYKKLVLYALQS